MKYVVKDECDNIIKEDILQNVNRCFAYNSLTENGMIYKINPDKTSKYPSLPNNVFIYNNAINKDENIDEIIDKIDWQYYIDRSYEKLGKLVSI